MGRSFFCLPSHIVFGIFVCIATAIFVPSLAHASELSAEFFVSAWLVRLWLAMVCATAIVVGVIVALNSREIKSSLEPIRDTEGKIVLSKEYKLSYRKLGGGLLCVLVGSALFVTCVFLLPDKRTGYSGIGIIKAHFTDAQYSDIHKLPVGNNKPAAH